MSKRRKFGEEFKREAVGLTQQPGAIISRVARDIGVGAGYWVVGGVSWRAGQRRLFPDRANHNGAFASVDTAVLG